MEKKKKRRKKGEKFVKLVKPKHYNSLSAAGDQATVCSKFGSRLSHDVNSHSINLIFGPSLMGLLMNFVGVFLLQLVVCGNYSLQAQTPNSKAGDLAHIHRATAKG